MYIGIPKEKFPEYMKRDKIDFDMDKYAYEKELKKMNVEEFIDFCIRNQRYIIRTPKEEIIQRSEQGDYNGRKNEYLITKNKY